MEFKYLEPEDIKTVESWWEFRGGFLPTAILPDLGFGIWTDDSLISAAWLDISLNRTMGWVCWVTVNPFRPYLGGKSIPSLLENVKKIGQLEGLLAIMGSCESHGLGSQFMKTGFQRGDTGISQYMHTYGT